MKVLHNFQVLNFALFLILNVSVHFELLNFVVSVSVKQLLYFSSLTY
jgi:hypothetical protein